MPPAAGMVRIQAQIMRAAMLHLMALERLAVPIPIAFTLWGWGRVPAAVVLPDAVAGAQAAPAVATVIEVQAVIDWPSLVRYRLQFAEVAAQKRPVWLAAHVDLLAEQLRMLCVAGKGGGALSRLGEELGATRQALSQLLKKHRYSTTTGEKELSAATPFDGMGARRTA